MKKCNGTTFLPHNSISLTFWTIFFTEKIGYPFNIFPVIGTWGTKYLKAVWANKQNRHDRKLPHLWWDIKLPNIDRTPPHGVRSLSKHSHYHTSQGAIPAVIGHQTLKNIEIFKIFKSTFLLRSIPCIFLHLYFYVNISHHTHTHTHTQKMNYFYSVFALQNF